MKVVPLQKRIEELERMLATIRDLINGVLNDEEEEEEEEEDEEDDEEDED